MTFKEGQPIYAQIADRLSDEILNGTYAPDSRVPGVREYAALLEVNVNTAVKAYELLARREVIYQKRGMGYFVATDAPEIIRTERRSYFCEHAMPQFFAQMKLLGISVDEMTEAYRRFMESHPNALAVAAAWAATLAAGL